MDKVFYIKQQNNKGSEIKFCDNQRSVESSSTYVESSI